MSPPMQSLNVQAWENVT